MGRWAVCSIGGRWLRLKDVWQATFDIILPSWHFAMMIKTQVQIPVDLFVRAKRVAGEKEWSFVEIVRRGLEYMSQVNLPDGPPGAEWHLPEPVAMGLPLAPEEEWIALTREPELP